MLFARSPANTRAKNDLLTAGWQCVLKLKKPVSLIYHLHVGFGNHIDLRTMGLLQNFLGKNPIRKMQFFSSRECR
jgi:hypothetical protein